MMFYGKGLRTLSLKDGEQPQMQENRYVDRLLTSYITCVNIENPKENGRNVSLSISKQDWGFYPAVGYATESDFFLIWNYYGWGDLTIGKKHNRIS